jgi:hypothetical protein
MADTSTMYFQHITKLSSNQSYSKMNQSVQIIFKTNHNLNDTDVVSVTVLSYGVYTRMTC